MKTTGTITWETIPDEIKRDEILAYLDPDSLRFFASTSKKSLKLSAKQLDYYEAFLDPRSIRFFCAPQKLYLWGPSIPLYFYELNGNGSPEKVQIEGKILQVACDQGTSVLARTDQDNIFIATTRGLYVRGKNSYGQLGLGHSKPCEMLTKVSSLSGDILQIAVSGQRSVVWTTDGLFVSGLNRMQATPLRFGQIGLGDTESCHNFTKLIVTSKIKKIIAPANVYRALYVLTEEGLYVSGRLPWGQDEGCNILTKVALEDKILDIILGDECIFVITDKGLLACGSNNCGKLGLGKGLENYDTLTKVPFEGKISRLISGKNCTFILTETGQLYACGSILTTGIDRGEKFIFRSNTFRRVPIEGKIFTVTASDNHTFILTDVCLYVCGANYAGELGLGNGDACYSFEKVPLSGPIYSIMAFNNRSLALTDQGLLTCGERFISGGDSNTFTLIKSLPEEVKIQLKMYREIKRFQSLNKQLNSTSERDAPADEVSFKKFKK